MHERISNFRVQICNRKGTQQDQVTLAKVISSTLGLALRYRWPVFECKQNDQRIGDKCIGIMLQAGGEVATLLDCGQGLSYFNYFLSMLAENIHAYRQPS